MAKPGIVWGGRTLDDLAAQVSVLPDNLNANVERGVDKALKEAETELRRYVATRGVKDHRPHSGGRIGETRRLINSVGSQLSYARGSNRVKGTFGYINNAPYYAGFQEYGTYDGSRILPMLALTDAFIHFQTKIRDSFNNGSIVNLEQGRYAG